MNLLQNVEHVSTEELEKLLGLKRKLVIKAGFDPTRPDLHLGHAVLLRKLRQFQDAGHLVALIIGDFTAMIGDPSGRNAARPPLTREEVTQAASTYTQQAFTFLDSSKTIIFKNSTWFDKFSAADMLTLASKRTVARMMERDDFNKRFADNKPIHLHEFLYPLLQGWDSVEIARALGSCDIEIGGSDQLFNLLVGRDLMKQEGHHPQLVMTMPLLEGTNAKFENGKVVGPKMSKTLNNSIGLQDDPHLILQKIMLIEDQVLWRYIQLLGDPDFDWKSPALGIFGVKHVFFTEIITKLHSKEKADEAWNYREKIACGKFPDDAPLHKIPEGGVRLVNALAEAGLTKSNSDGIRLVKGAAIHVNDRVLAPTEVHFTLEPGNIYFVRIGSKNRQFVRFE